MPEEVASRPGQYAPSAGQESIAPQFATEIRRLAHDLSNSLEVIIQASYLLQISNLEGDAKRWAQMVDQGAQQAAEINRKLRDYVRANTV